MKPTVTWIVLADGDAAKFFEHEGPGKGLRALPDLEMSQAHLKSGDIMADRPGRSGGSGAAGSRSSVEYKSNPVDVRERRFVENLAKVLDAQLAEGAFTRLIIAAAPIALGELRPALSDAVKKAVIAELPKDLTNIPTAKLAEHFDGLIAV